MAELTSERRKRERRILFVALSIAAALHVVALAFVPWTHPPISWAPNHDAVELKQGQWSGTPIEVHFGPPKILGQDGEFIQEPPDRVLEAMRPMQVPPLCLGREIPPAAPGSGELRLTVNASGRVDLSVLNASTGDECWDQVAVRVAGDLWYRWLPGDRETPLEVLQPITVGLGLD